MDEYPQPELNFVLNEYSHERLWEIWEAGKRGETFNTDEETHLYEAMEGHLQYARIWDRLDVATDDEIMQGEVNVVMHILFHGIVANQLAANDPPVVRQVMGVLKQKGLKEHEAAHAIASAMAFEIFDMMQKRRMFDLNRYTRELRKLPLQIKNPPRRKK